MTYFPSLRRTNDFSRPMQAINRMQRQIDRMFDDFLNGNWNQQMLPAFPEMSFQPPCDMQETESHYLLSFDLPGLSKSDVKIELQDDVLVVSGERKEESQTGKGENLRTEKYYGSFERSIALPANAKTDAIEAQFEKGVLHVAIPKSVATQKQRIQVTEGKPNFVSRLLGKKEEKAA